MIFSRCGFAIKSYLVFTPGGTRQYVLTTPAHETSLRVDYSSDWRLVTAPYWHIGATVPRVSLP